MPLPKINQKIIVRIPEGSWEGHYSSYVEEINENGITVAQPMFRDALLPLPVGEEVLVEFVENEERWSFPSRVLGYSTQVVRLLSLSLPAPGEIRRHQQRDFVRLDVNLPFRYALIPDPPPEGQETTKPVYKTGRTLDISGSGAQLVVNESLPVGVRLAMVLNLQGYEVPMKAEVVRNSQHVAMKEVWAGVRFTEVEERDRERIVRYIFSEQRTRRQKGLL